MTTISVVCYKYKPLKNGELPLKVRVFKDKKARYINLGVSVKPQDWDFGRNRLKEEAADKDMLEKLIASKICEARSKLVELKSENKEFTATTLVEQVQSKPKAMTVGALFLQFLQDLEQEKRTGYRLSIRQAYNSLIKFNRHLDIPFSEMDCNWLRKYEIWQRKQGKFENTIGIRLRNIRTIFNLAINMGLIKQEDYPFRKFKVSRLHQETVKRALTKEEIHSVINYTVDGKDFYTRLAVTLFTFSYFMGGINFVDMAFLTEKNIMDSRLVYRRKKTAKLINLPLQEEALLVLKRYKNNGSPYLFPILSNLHKTEQQRLNRLHKVITKVNKALKAIGEELNIPIKLTTYVARHSYATTICLSNGAPIETLSKMMGHTSIRSTQIYAKITAEKVSNDMERLSKQIESMEQFICQTI